MKKLLVLSVVTVVVVFLAAGMSGCGSSGSQPAPTPTQTATPTPTPSATSTSNAFASLRADATISGSAALITPQQHQAAKIDHAISRQAAISVNAAPVDIYVWPVSIQNGFWSLLGERKITSAPASYSSVHLVGTAMVFSAIVNGYNQIFTTTVPAEGNTMGETVQLTTDAEHHWLPHLSPAGDIVFTKFDPNSEGDVVCVIENARGATENCFNFSSTTPVLKGANIWHASWGLDGKIFFEAWGGPLKSDEIYMVIWDGGAISTGLTQITNNAGTNNYDECPSISRDGAYMAVDTWNDATHHYEITLIDLNTRQRPTIIGGKETDSDFWDPLYTIGPLVWVSPRDINQNQEIYTMSYSPVQFTHNSVADYFASTLR